MITNPNTCGLFERDIKEIADAVHAAAAILLRRRELQRHRRPGAPGRSRRRCDAHQPAQDLLHARMAAAGRARAGGAVGGAGALRAAAVHGEDADGGSICRGRRRRRRTIRQLWPHDAFHGQMGMFTRALAYILSHGADGLRQVAEDAVLNANYILRPPEGPLDAPFGVPAPACTRRCSSDDGLAEGTARRSTSPRADRRGLSPDDDVFPAGGHGAMLIEPTETESKAPAYGIRWVEDVDRAAEPLSLARTACYPMPANNLVLVYRLS
jgi:glycine dehydrogenase subunit 2